MGRILFEQETQSQGKTSDYLISPGHKEETTKMDEIVKDIGGIFPIKRVIRECGGGGGIRGCEGCHIR